MPQEVGGRGIAGTEQITGINKNNKEVAEMNTSVKKKGRYPLWWLLLITVPMLLAGIALAYPSFNVLFVYSACLMVVGGFGSLFALMAILAWD